MEKEKKEETDESIKPEIGEKLPDKDVSVNACEPATTQGYFQQLGIKI